MTAKNDITGDKIQTKSSSAYADNYDAIFRKEEDKDERVARGVVGALNCSILCSTRI